MNNLRDDIKFKIHKIKNKKLNLFQGLEIIVLEYSIKKNLLSLKV